MPSNLNTVKFSILSIFVKTNLSHNYLHISHRKIQIEQNHCALQMKLYASIVSLAGLLLYIKRMVQLPSFPYVPTNLIFDVPLPESIRFASVVAFATPDSVRIAPGKVNTRIARTSFSFARNLFMIRFSITLFGYT